MLAGEAGDRDVEHIPVSETEAWFRPVHEWLNRTVCGVG